MKLPPGKLPPQILQKLFATVAGSQPKDPRVMIGPRLGEDCAVIEFGERCLVAKSDPITFTADRIGWYAVQVNANDVAVMGARPCWFFATILLPETDAIPLAESIMADIISACAALQVSVCGGHTEVTPGLQRPIVCGHMLGEVSRDGLVRKERMRPGDAVLLARGVAIEGTAILAREAASRLAALPPSLLERARNLLFDPGISVVRAALAAAAAAPLHGMHDPTEGGLIGALCELAEAAGVGFAIESSQIPVLPETRAVCDTLQLDAFRLIASGALLVVAATQDAPCVVTALAEAGVAAALIGRVIERERGLRLDGSSFTFPQTDELTRALG